MHRGQTRGETKNIKACKKHVNFTKSGRNFTKLGKNNFLEIEGEMYCLAKIGRKFEILSQRLRKEDHQKFLADQNRNFFWERVKFEIFSKESEEC